MLFRSRISATEWVVDELGPDDAVGPPRSEKLLGLLIHRLFESADDAEIEADAAAVATRALRLLRPDELGLLDRPEVFAAIAAELWLLARGRQDVIDALSGAERFYEVPFSMLLAVEGTSRVVRGTIDCLVRKGDGRATVVEFKTGCARDAHRRQLDLYVRAARALRVGAGHRDASGASDGELTDVTGVLIYV